MIKIKLNSIHDYERSTALGIGPLETVQKRAPTLFPQVKITSCCVRDSYFGINKPLKLV